MAGQTIFSTVENGCRQWCPSPEPALPIPFIHGGVVLPVRHVIVFGTIETDAEWFGLHVLESGGRDADVSVLDELGKVVSNQQSAMAERRVTARHTELFRQNQESIASRE
jgi:hypothetical protein